MIKKKYLLSKILNKGDIIMLSEGAHGFRVLEECEMYEVKQGPYDESRIKKNLKGY